MPSASVLMGSRVATPLVTVTGPPTLAPSMPNCTVPVGVPPPSEATVALKTTGWPTRDGLTDDRTVVVVGYPRTTWPIGGHLALFNPASPQYLPLTPCEPRTTARIPASTPI